MFAETRQYGLWQSPLTPQSLSQERRLETAYWDGESQSLVWLEGRSGQGVLVVWQGGRQAVRDLTADFNVRAEVGYGGGDFTVHAGQAFFVAHPEGRIWRQSLSGGPAQAITPAFGQAASPVVSPNGRWVVYVHHDDGADRLAIVDSAGDGWPQILTSGHDFYMQPRWSPDGSRLAWIAWDHPQMPWDGSLLYVARLAAADPGHHLWPPRVLDVGVIAGNNQTSIFQPEFSADGNSLFFVSDETGWGRIAQYDLQTNQKRWLTPAEVECGAPAWLQDMRTYAVSCDGSVLWAVFNQQGSHQLQRIGLDKEPEEGGAPAEIVSPLREYTEITHIAASPTARNVTIVASADHIPRRVIALNEDTPAEDAGPEDCSAVRIVARSSTEAIPAQVLSRCEPLSWTSSEGQTAHGLFYPPAGEKLIGAGKPPLIVMVHGGPTGQTRAGWKAEAQFFATRGYAVLYVNYRGSTGYGRSYMLNMRGNWGVVDVEDCLSGAGHLAHSGRIDGERMAIMGGSAGGFTVLQTMVQHPHAFSAGVNLFGVADHFRLAFNTHKFESRYLDTLLGPLPQAAAIYRERSPAQAAQRIKRPLAVFQGAIDRVVPKEQSEAIVAALRRSGVPHIYHIYEGEGHGWRKRETIEHYYRAVEEFLRQHIVYA